MRIEKMEGDGARATMSWSFFLQPGEKGGGGVEKLCGCWVGGRKMYQIDSRFFSSPEGGFFFSKKELTT